MVNRPIRVAAVNDYDLVVEGVAALLSHFPDRIQVSERILIGEPIDAERIDVALYDTYGRVGTADQALTWLAAHRQIDKVAVFSLDLRPRLIDEARLAGASGFISKSLTGSEIADALVRVADGEDVEALSSGRKAPPTIDWPGRSAGLTERESQVLVLCAEGMTNREIADALYIGLETVKTHLRNVFKRLGLRNRTQAAAYADPTGPFRRSLGRTFGEGAAGR